MRLYFAGRKMGSTLFFPPVIARKNRVDPIFLITVSGAYSGVGKTHAVTGLLEELKDWAALKVTVVRDRCSRKANCRTCRSLRGDYELIDEPTIIRRKGTDTERMLEAGAKKVLWLKTKRAFLKEALKAAFSKLRGFAGVVVETTSGVRFLRPDFVIFVNGRAGAALRTEAAYALRRADLVVEGKMGSILFFQPFLR